MSIDADVLRFVQAAKQKGEKIVLATGVFDILHQEHEEFLRRAKHAGDVLIVGIETDARVTAMKGPGRPINSQEKRIAALKAVSIADVVFVLPEKFNTPADRENLIAVLRPDILAVSSHSAHLPAKRELLQKYGGEVVIVHQHNPAISTTLLLQKKQS